jgi:carbon-monoxide dehydrogenase large subunit
VIAVVTGAKLATVITPWVGVLTHLKGIKSAPQHAIAVERACWQGEAVCAVVARTRAEAEDACAQLEIDYEPLAAVTDAETALDPATPVIHPELADNLTFDRSLVAGDPDRVLPTRTRSPKRHSCSAATPASPTSRAPSSPTGTPASSA